MKSLSAALSLLVLALAVPASGGEPGAAVKPLTPPQQRLLARCARAPLDPDALLAEPAQRKDLEAVLSTAEAEELQLYEACRSLRGGEGCASLRALGGQLKDSETSCLESSANARFVGLTVKGGDAVGACLKQLAILGERSPTGERACKALVDAVRAGDPSAACAALRGRDPKFSCKDELVFWSGDPALCVSGDRRWCQEFAVFVAGLRQPARCAASPFCQALRAAPASGTAAPSAKADCDALRRSFSKALCERLGRADDDRRRAELAEKSRVDSERLKRELKEAAARRDKERSEAAIRDAIRAEERARREAEARAAAKAKQSPQFRKGEPMEKRVDVNEIMRKLEQGLPLEPSPAPEKPKKDNPGGPDVRSDKR